MVRHSNYWFESCPTKRQTTAGLVRNADVLIIGGGIAGLSLLYQLVNAGVSNSYLLEETSVGYHASGRSSGQLMMRGAKLFSELPEAIGVEYLNFIAENNRRFIKGIRNVKFDTDLRESGGLRLAATPDELERLEIESSFIAKHLGFEYPILTAKQLNAVFPATKFAGAMFVPHESSFNPYKIINGFRDFIEQKGSRVITDAQVEQVVPNADGSLAVSIRHRGIIRTKSVVYCMNAYTPELLPQLSSKMSSFRGQMIATDVLTEPILKSLPTMSMTCNNCNEYFRLHGGRLLVGGMRHAVRGRQEGILFDGEVSPAVYERLRSFITEYIPVMKGVKYTHTWSGIMCATLDELPLVGPIPELPNQFIMAGFNGYGYGHALMSSIIIKDYLTRGKSEHPGTKIFHPNRWQEQTREV